jgi:hypothetical protein
MTKLEILQMLIIAMSIYPIMIMLLVIISAPTEPTQWLTLFTNFFIRTFF